MFVCNCTLASPSRCFECKNYSSSFFYGTSYQNWFKYMNEVLGAGVDLDRYELVEKKDWKIKDLEKRIGECKEELTIRDSLILDLSFKNTETNTKLKELEEELKKLKEE